MRRRSARWMSTERGRWRLPFEVRPYALEAPTDYFARLKRANYCEFVSLAHRERLAATAYPSQAHRARTLAVELLGGLPPDTFGTPPYLSPKLCEVPDCECALPIAESRLLCVQCAGGEQVGLVANLEPFVCGRHQRWVGPGAGIDGQLAVGMFPEFRRAARHHGRLLRSGRLDPLRFRSVWRILDEAFRSGWVSPPEAGLSSDWRWDPERHTLAVTYPSAIELYRSLEDGTTLGRVLHPENDLESVEAMLSALIERATRASCDPAAARALRYHLRPDFYRVARATTQGWHESLIAKYPPPRVAPHDRDLSTINYSRWPKVRSGIPPGFPGFDSATSPLHILDDGGERFRHEFWYNARGRRFDELGKGWAGLSVWICPAGHHISALPAVRRRSKRSGCRACAGQVAIPGVTDISTTNPDAFAFWDHAGNSGLPYWEQTSGRDRVAAWRCPTKGHQFERPINLFLADPRCPKCDVPNQRKVNLLEEFVEFAAWWDNSRNEGHDPSSIAMYSEIIAWRCGEGHPFLDTLHDLQRHGGNCPVCTHRRLIPGVNDLQTLYPDVAEEFSLALNGGLTPERVWPATTTQFLWVCRKKGHVYPCSPRERTALGIGCTRCTGRKSTPGETDLGTIKPEVAARWHTFANGRLTPSDVHPGSARLVYFTCLCDRPYRCEVRVMRQDRYCRRCTDKLRAWMDEQQAD